MTLMLFVGTLLIGMLAQWHVKRTYARYSQMPTLSGATGAQVAAAILQRAGIYDVSIEEQDGLLSDHYDPSRKRLVLSRENYYGESAAALGVAAHECGHAIQHQRAYLPLHLRMAAVGVTNFASQVVMWLPLLGMFTGLLAVKTGFLIMALAWGVIMAFNLITLPVEFDASRRAKVVLGQLGFIRPGAESTAVSQVLNAAGWTYVAAFVSSLAYFLWHLLPFISGRHQED